MFNVTSVPLAKKSIVCFCRISANTNKANYLLYHIVCCFAAFCRLRLRRFTTHKGGGGEVLHGGFCRSTWTKILAIEKILRDNIKNNYKILQDNIHKQRQTKIHKEKYIGNWKVGENKKIEALKNILGRQP